MSEDVVIGMRIGHRAIVSFAKAASGVPNYLQTFQALISSVIAAGLIPYLCASGGGYEVGSPARLASSWTGLGTTSSDVQFGQRLAR